MTNISFEKCCYIHINEHIVDPDILGLMRKMHDEALALASPVDRYMDPVRFTLHPNDYLVLRRQLREDNVTINGFRGSSSDCLTEGVLVRARAHQPEGLASLRMLVFHDLERRVADLVEDLHVPALLP